MSKKRKVSKPKKVQESLIAIVLDESGSMSNVIKQTQDNYNEFLQSQKKLKLPAKMSLIRFATNVNVVSQNVKLDDVKEMQDYRPDGFTALYDGIGKAIELLESETAKQSKKSKSKCLVVILTDGGENSSKDYNQSRIAESIKRLEASGNWTFVFLGATQELVLSAQKIGIPLGNTVMYNQANPAAAINQLSAHTISYRSCSQSKTTSFFDPGKK